MDVWWFRLPRRDDDPPGGVGRFTRGHFCVLIDRGDYWQCAYLIRKGSDAALRAAGIEELRRRFATLLPWLGDRVDSCGRGTTCACSTCGSSGSAAGIATGCC